MTLLGVLPFVLLLLLIAILPLAAGPWWDLNRLKALVSGACALPAGAWVAFRSPGALAHAAFEYLSFVSLLGALDTISGGVRLRGLGRGTPWSNAGLLAAALASMGIAGGIGVFMMSRAQARPPMSPAQLPRVVIRKAARELVLYDGDHPLRRYRIALGGCPKGAKEIEGDRRTPEGEFYICTRNAQSRFHRFLGLSYPGPRDARRGVERGLLSTAQAEEVLRAHREGECPPWHTRLGGEVGLHGGGTSSDWTAGCVALSDRDLDELWGALRIGDPVTIVP